MREPATLSRRAAVTTLSFFAAAAMAPAATAVPALACDSLELDAVVARYHSTKAALKTTFAALERAIPPLHPSLDLTNCRSGLFQSEGERRFDGERAERGIDRHGRAVQRRVVTLDTIRLDLDLYSDNRSLRGELYRMRRRLRVRQAKLKDLEKSFGIWDRRNDATNAERALQDLTERLFEHPATTMAAIVTQAKALSAFSSIEDFGYARHESARLGLILADGLQQMAMAA